jgi:hypothetical protein
MAGASPTYRPRSAGHGILYQVVRDHFETLRTETAAARDGDGLPAFVEQEFRDFLRCGWLAGGFARFRCGACGFDRLVPFSCKGRALCASCGGRRMAERAAHLVEDVLPDVPVRQWVLSLPYRLRYQLAWDHDRCRAVAGILLRAVFRVLADRARDDGVDAGRGGAVAVIQRFGGALNLNLHIHALVLDGVFVRDAPGPPAFHAVRRLTTLDVAEVLATVEARIARRRGQLGRAASDGAGDDADSFSHDVPVLAGLAAASVQGRLALGPRPGGRPGRVGRPPAQVDAPARGACHARSHGFDLHAGLVVPAGQRERLERVCRYVLRPPVTAERVTRTPDGQVRLALRHPWRDGTTALVLDPVEFLGRLAVLIPKPRVNLLLYYGVLGARSAWRAEVVPRRVSADPEVADGLAMDPGSGRAVNQHEDHPSAHRLSWARLMQRTFGFDVLLCSRCGGRLRLVALIEDGAVIVRILRHLGLPTGLPEPRPAREPPWAHRSADGRASDTSLLADEGPSAFTPCS